MNVRINSSFKFRIACINYSNDVEMCITLSSDEMPQQEQCRYSTLVKSGKVETKKSVNLLEYARCHVQRTEILSRNWRYPWGRMHGDAVAFDV